MMQCSTCNKHFNRKDNYERHMVSPIHLRKIQEKGTFSCVCGKVYFQSPSLSRHKRRCKAVQEKPSDETIAEAESVKEELLSVKEENHVLKEAQTKHATEIAELKALLKHQSTVIKSLERQLKTFEASGLLPPSDTQPRKAAVRKKPNAKERKEIATSQENKCVDCKKELSEYYEIDHIIGLQYGGDNHPDNLQALCCECHSKKSILENKHRKEIQSAIRTILTES